MKAEPLDHGKVADLQEEGFTHTYTYVKRAGLGSLSKKKDEVNSFEERWTDGKVRDNERNIYCPP